MTDENTENTLRLIEKRKHPRFLLTNEQFREKKTGKIYNVYDLSRDGLAIKIEEKNFKENGLIQGILNLHVDSIEITARVLGYYGDRAALKIEGVSTYARSVLEKALSPKRLGNSLKLVKEKLPVADFWYHGVCNTDFLFRFNDKKKLEKADLFFANFYFGAYRNAEDKMVLTTGICQSFGSESREPTFLADEPVKMESIDIDHDKILDPLKVEWAMKIIDSAIQMDTKLKELLMKEMKV